MRNKSKQPVILVVEEFGKEYGFIKNWLETNNFSMRETADIFEVLDEISDFTMRGCPDVFMLRGNSDTSDFAKINELIQAFSDSSDILVTCVSNEEKSADGVSVPQKLSKTEANLNALLPVLSRAAVRRAL
jgi:hypothetical protein